MGGEWSPGREKNLHALVYQLRRRLTAWEPERGGGRLVRAGAGYRLALGPGELDVAVFSELARRGPGGGAGRGRGGRAGAVRAGAGAVAGGGAGRRGAAVPAAGRGGGPARGAEARGDRGADRV